MIYEIEFVKSAKKALKKINSKDQIRILKSIYTLQKDPRKGNVRPMVGLTAWRLRVGDYRVVYDIYDNKLLIILLKIAHRREVYKK